MPFQQRGWRGRESFGSGIQLPERRRWVHLRSFSARAELTISGRVCA